ncbi:MAG TPA: peptidoglycan editing factor PgeF [Limnochordia bacterium]
MSPSAREHRAGDFIYFTSPRLAALPGVRHAFTGRTGGFSLAPYSSANLGAHVGDAPAAVRANRLRAAALLGFPVQSWVLCEQVHGSRVAVVGLADRGRGTAVGVDDPGPVPATDALACSAPGITLVLLFADCLPVFLAVPGRGVGLAHAGWRGALAGVAAKAAARLAALCDVPTSAVHAWIGPGIGSCCYRVDADRASRFAARFGKAVVRTDGASLCIDLAGAVEVDLVRAGVPPAQIDVAGLCTACAGDRFFSYRRDGQTGRMAGLIRLAGDGRS